MLDHTFISLLQEAAGATLGHELDGLTLDTPLADLGVDSVGLLEMVGVIEDRLGVRLADDQIARIVTVRDILTLVNRGNATDPRPG
jgi:act minimal PKS acyl carrier protein